jgi:hypothetical protein
MQAKMQAGGHSERPDAVPYLAGAPDRISFAFQILIKIVRREISDESEGRIRNKRKMTKQTKSPKFFVCFVIFRLFRILSSTACAKFAISSEPRSVSLFDHTCRCNQIPKTAVFTIATSYR